MFSWDGRPHVVQYSLNRIGRCCSLSGALFISHMKDACDGIVACEQMPLTSADLAMLTPKPAAVFGVTDEHLAQLCAKYL